MTSHKNAPGRTSLPESEMSASPVSGSHRRSRLPRRDPGRRHRSRRHDGQSDRELAPTRQSGSLELPRASDDQPASESRQRVDWHSESHRRSEANFNSQEGNYDISRTAATGRTTTAKSSAPRTIPDDQRVEPKATTSKTPEPKASSSKTTEPKTATPRPRELKAPVSEKTAEPQHTASRTTEPKAPISDKTAEQKSPVSKNTESEAKSSKITEPKSTAPKATEPKAPTSEKTTEPEAPISEKAADPQIKTAETEKPRESDQHLESAQSSSSAALRSHKTSVQPASPPAAKSGTKIGVPAKVFKKTEPKTAGTSDSSSPPEMASVQVAPAPAQVPQPEKQGPEEESFTHISEAPTQDISDNTPSHSSRPSDATLVDKKSESNDSSLPGASDYASVLKPGVQPGQNGTREIQKRGSNGNDAYPELDEMPTNELHPAPRPSSNGGIRWAPWNVPLKRRAQTLVVLMHCLCIVITVSVFFALCANPFVWPLLLLYLVHVLSSKASTDGSLKYRSEWFRKSYIWHLFADYFPAKLHKTHDLPSTRKYIFGYHPHGIISHGAWVAFATDALGFSEKFPGITNSLLTLDSNFRVPLYRDYILAMGVRSVSKESIQNILTKGGYDNHGMGRGVTVVVGGARESLEAQPGHLRLILKERKGFIKVAVRTGADLVPVLSFGENDLYDQLPSKDHPFLHKVQMFVLKVWKFTLPFMHGRGIFNYDVGLMPYRRPLNVVVGAPIKVTQSDKVDQAEIDRLHELYVAELEKLWDRYKDEFSEARKEELQIMP